MKMAELYVKLDGSHLLCCFQLTGRRGETNINRKHSSHMEDKIMKGKIMKGKIMKGKIMKDKQYQH